MISYGILLRKKCFGKDLYICLEFCIKFINIMLAIFRNKKTRLRGSQKYQVSPLLKDITHMTKYIWKEINKSYIQTELHTCDYQLRRATYNTLESLTS